MLTFRLVCIVEGLMMLALGVFGLVVPYHAMELMAAMPVSDHPSLYPLMRMHTATDLGLGLGFLLVAWRPLPAFPAIILCLVANFAHGLVHVLELTHGNAALDHAVVIGGLVVMSIVLAALYPWRRALEYYRSAPRW